MESEAVTIHYHGTPITPREVLLKLAGGFFCVSFAEPRDVEVCHEIGQGVMLDNGAFTFWTKGGTPTSWRPYYDWCDRWLDCPTTWAIIPDVIDGGEIENDALIREWPFGERGVPVWHLHESLTRLVDLCNSWPRVCFGSSGQYITVLASEWRDRVDHAFDKLSRYHRRLPWLHMLRGMRVCGRRWPFASVDSTNLARNFKGSYKQKAEDPFAMMRRLDAVQCPTTWRPSL